MINWMRLLAVLQRFTVHVFMWVLSAFILAVIGAGIARVALDLEESDAFLFVGGPLLLVFSAVYARWMPASLARGNVLMNEPKYYGPWFIRK